MFKYFFETYGNHTQPDTHWHYRIRRSKSPNICTASHSSYEYSTTDRQKFKGDKSTALLVPPIIYCTPRLLPTAPTKPPLYDDNLSMGKRLWPLTGPMISYCPPWPPPHQKCWYSTNVELNLRTSQPTSYMHTQYYRRNTTQYGVDLSISTTADNSYPVPPAPTASEKNLLRPP